MRLLREIEIFDKAILLLSVTVYIWRLLSLEWLRLRSAAVAISLYIRIRRRGMVSFFCPLFLICDKFRNQSLVLTCAWTCTLDTRILIRDTWSCVDLRFNLMHNRNTLDYTTFIPSLYTYQMQNKEKKRKAK